MDASSGRRSKMAALLHGLPGHPLHPPLTDATIGMFVLAAGLAVLAALGVSEDATGKACWLALIGGLVVALPTAATGFADWIRLDCCSLWRHGSSTAAGSAETSRRAAWFSASPASWC